MYVCIQYKRRPPAVVFVLAIDFAHAIKNVDERRKRLVIVEHICTRVGKIKRRVVICERDGWELKMGDETTTTLK